MVFDKKRMEGSKVQKYFLFGPEGPAHLMVSLILRSSGCNVRGESRAPSAVSAKKSPSRARDGDEGAAGRNLTEKCFPDKRSLIRLQANQ